MTCFLRFLICSSLAGAVAAIGGEARAPAENLRLGEVEFESSGHPDAQPHFRRGVAALHSFWYQEAFLSFQAALRIDPKYAMAWWGIAMCYDRPFLGGSNEEAGRRVLEQIRDTSELTPREQAYIDALRILYANGTLAERTVGYARAMEKLYRNYPDDLEAAAFYALSLLGHRWSTEEGTARQERAGAVATEVYRRNPAHPGAAHYILHSYDEPLLAERALDAARHYAEIAPDVPHALHMPSHIFLQRGMWPEVIASNEAAWNASENWVRSKQLPSTYRDYHNLHWLIYACLQEGRYARATELVERFRAMRSDVPPGATHYLNDALATFLVETRRWDRAEGLLNLETPVGATGATPTPAELCSTDATEPLKWAAANARSFIVAYAAAVRGTPGAGPQRDALRMAATGEDISARYWHARLLMVTAASAAREKAFAPAIAALREATRIDEELGRSPGPPSYYKPSHELLGEVLLAAGQPAEATLQFEKSLARNPNRALSLLGAARAAAAAGDKKAALAHYGRLREVWRNADRNLPELREAEAFE